MSGSFPRLMADSIFDVSPETLREMGVRLALLDVDNTIAPYGDDETTAELASWVGALKTSGVAVFILSNNRGHRPGLFAGALGIGWVGSAWKPLPFKARRVMRELGVRPEECAVIGDQIFTDGFCAALSGAAAVVVRPIRLGNAFLRLRYAAEYPLRQLYLIKVRHGK